MQWLPTLHQVLPDQTSALEKRLLTGPFFIIGKYVSGDQ